MEVVDADAKAGDSPLLLDGRVPSESAIWPQGAPSRPSYRGVSAVCSVPGLPDLDVVLLTGVVPHVGLTQHRVTRPRWLLPACGLRGGQ